MADKGSLHNRKSKQNETVHIHVWWWCMVYGSHRFNILSENSNNRVIRRFKWQCKPFSALAGWNHSMEYSEGAQLWSCDNTVYSAKPIQYSQRMFVFYRFRLLPFRFFWTFSSSFFWCAPKQRRVLPEIVSSNGNGWVEINALNATLSMQNTRGLNLVLSYVKSEELQFTEFNRKAKNGYTHTNKHFVSLSLCAWTKVKRNAKVRSGVLSQWFVWCGRIIRRY